MKLGKRHTLKSAYAKREYSESNFIPYKGHWNKNIIITKKKELLMVMKLQGFSFETADDEDVDLKKNVRNTLLKSLATSDYALWFHTLRRKKHVEIEGDFTGTFCKQLDKAWKEKHSNTESFINELYITIVQRRDAEGTTASISDVINKLANKADSAGEDFEYRQHAKDITEITNRLAGSLKDYSPVLLGVRETEKGAFSEIFEFLGALVNCGNYRPMLVPTTDADKYIGTHRLYFGTRAIEARGPDGKSRFAGCVSIKEYATYTSAGMLDTFLQLPFELLITQSYIFSDRGVAINKMSLHQRRMSSAGDKAVSQMEELSIAMDLASGGHIGFGKHALSVMVFEDELQKLEDALSLCYGELVNCGINPARESFNLQATYWSQLPANAMYIARGSEINTMNLAGFASLHNYPIGQARDNHWGNCVTVFDTTSGTPYFFNFHVRDVGHTTIIGPTGAGKTVLMNFLMAQAQKYGARMFFFDKDRGAEIFIRALGGVYSIIEPNAVCGFNPLQLTDTYENRTFLTEWIRTMVMAVHKVDITPADNDRIAEAIAGNFKLPRESRRLCNIAPFLGLEGPGTLASRLKIWHSGETHSGLFDNEIDELDFSKNKVFGFEMGKLLADGLSLSPTLLYLFHKINISLDGTPTVIVLDEAWALIDNEVFAPKIKDWLKVLRKLNAMVVFATQSVEDASKSDISDTLVQQTATQIFLPNHKATAEYQKAFMISDREFQLIKTTDPGSRYFLVKQGQEVAIARIDLSGMDDIISILSGRIETVLLLDEIREEVGDDPDKWLPVFYKKYKTL